MVLLDEKYEECLEAGLEYQDYVAEQLYNHGIPLMTYSSQKYQFLRGENKAGIEIKLDRKFRETGNFYVEIAEKRNCNNDVYVPSGIFRNDNTWLYVIGDYEDIFVFRGIKWGQDISTVEGLVYCLTDPSYGGIEFYTRDGDKPSIGIVKLKHILYGFWQGKFCNITIIMQGKTNWLNFREVVFEKFNNGYQGNEYTYVWKGDKSWVLLGYDELSKTGAFYMGSEDITISQKEWVKEQIKKSIKEDW